MRDSARPGATPTPGGRDGNALSPRCCCDCRHRSSAGVDQAFFEHEPVRTSEEPAAARPGHALGQGAKAMVARTRKPGLGKSLALFVLPVDGQLDRAKFKRNLRLQDVRFAEAGEVEELIDGACPVAFRRLASCSGWPPTSIRRGSRTSASPATAGTDPPPWRWPWMTAGA